jgi:aspartate kinase
MVGVKGFDASILEILTRHKAWIVSKSSNANTITHYLAAKPAQMRAIISDLEEKFENASITGEKVAMVSIIGSDISRPGLVAEALGALHEAEIEVMGMQYQIRNVDVQLIIDPKDFDACVRVLHEVLIQSEEPRQHQCVAA